MTAVPWELLIVLATVALLILAYRPLFRGMFGGRAKRDYGLLREVATASSERAAATVKMRLRAHGIRVTTALSEDGDRLRIMVFPADEQRAIELLLEEGWPPVEP